ncbi:charged multivesicular body protein 7 [Selaginella moellendorffii]|uniref:charged multivesicular body protein 7 n=1 Tax=Selaginella moellendorffii TaxID=88036 RepID=UPI000D1C4795|nr:charged multivesicular body protein 7 [Selaginella moellendorffii]|eukprot:XP_002989143.2 charged multivesicular body protein 7 [Selaginella moellendorffii]
MRERERELALARSTSYDMGEVEVRTLVEREVPGWAEDDVKVDALFKAFSGQREDWQGRLDFWRALIVKLARHLGLIVIDGREVQLRWFLRDGLLPLCLNDVLREMLRSGELQALEQQERQQRTSSLGRALAWALGFQTAKDTIDTAVGGRLVVTVLLKERVAHVCKTLADTSWKSDCIVTMKSFVGLFGETDDAKAAMHYLLDKKLARHVCIDERDELIEGLKISLVQSCVSALNQVDYHMLQLHWTSEKMKQRLDALDQRVSQLREAAVGAKDKRVALRHLRSMKVLASSRDKCADLMARIQEILDAISDAEATKKVSEAIQLGNRAMREHHVTLEEVHEQLKEMDEAMVLTKVVGDALGGPASIDAVEDEDLLQEIASLEEEVRQEPGGHKEELAGTISTPDEEVALVVEGFSNLQPTLCCSVGPRLTHTSAVTTKICSTLLL